MDDVGIGAIGKQSAVMLAVGDIHDAVSRSTDPWRGARVTSVQAVVPMPTLVPFGAIGSGQGRRWTRPRAHAPVRPLDRRA